MVLKEILCCFHFNVLKLMRQKTFSRDFQAEIQISVNFVLVTGTGVLDICQDHPAILSGL